MLNWKPSLGRQFLFWIAICLLLIVVPLLWTKQSLCPPKEQNIWTIKGERDTTHSGEINNVLIAEQQKFAKNKEKANSNFFNDYYPPIWLCEEIKFTDLLLAYFTYCLVIVGWFGIRNSELTVKNLERAFLSVSPTKITKLYRPPDEEGHTVPFIRLTLHVHNAGRTRAAIQKIYGEFSRNPPSGDVPIYRDGRAEPTDLAIAANQESDIFPIAFEDDFMGEQFFWGYLEYSDIFKIRHVARFCARIVPADPPSLGKFQLAGSDGWREET